MIPLERGHPIRAWREGSWRTRGESGLRRVQAPAKSNKKTSTSKWAISNQHLCAISNVQKNEHSIMWDEQSAINNQQSAKKCRFFCVISSLTCTSWRLMLPSFAYLSYTLIITLAKFHFHFRGWFIIWWLHFHLSWMTFTEVIMITFPLFYIFTFFE